MLTVRRSAFDVRRGLGGAYLRIGVGRVGVVSEASRFASLHRGRQAERIGVSAWVVWAW